MARKGLKKSNVVQLRQKGHPNSTSAAKRKHDHYVVALKNSGWGWPLGWIALIPVVTVTLTLITMDQISHTDACVGGGFIGGDYWCQPVPVALSLTPGILNLVPIVWLWSKNPKTRLAASVATILGAVRLVVPLMFVFAGMVTTDFAEGAQVVIGTGPFEPVFPNNNSLEPLLVSIMLWLATFVAIAVIASVHLGESKLLPQRDRS